MECLGQFRRLHYHNLDEHSNISIREVYDTLVVVAHQDISLLYDENGNFASLERPFCTAKY